MVRLTAHVGVRDGRTLSAHTLKGAVADERLYGFSRGDAADIIGLRQPFLGRELVPGAEHAIRNLALDRLGNLPIKRYRVFPINWTAHTDPPCGRAVKQT